MRTDNKSGITTIMFAEPYPVTAFPNSASYEPTSGMAVGEEHNDMGGTRLIVRYDTVPARKVTGQKTPWPNHEIYLSERDVSGWKKEGTK